ncbi:PhoX family phosphatase [uncultured Kocuria sp.]|uniref:PhoX family protein n=1 Tax=uncultured Kocuria sp. TaxID=259305 RepID=UPI00259637E6|nr:PhoX family phosphatase [uncultured Kocuria sp.]
MAPQGRKLLPLLNFTSSRSHRTCVYKCGDACAKPVSNTSDNEYFRDVARRVFDRRRLLKGAGAAAMTVGGAAVTAGCATSEASADSVGAPSGSSDGASSGDIPDGMRFDVVAPNTQDAVVVPHGYDNKVLIRWGDPVVSGAPQWDLNQQTPEAAAQQFGFNPDFAALLPIEGSDKRFLFVCNHEYTTPQQMFPGYDADNPSENDVKIEWASHGLTVLEVEGNDQDGSLKPVMGKYNRRITGTTEFTLTGPAAGKELLKTKADPSGTRVLGTLGNCAGGLTPWGTVLSGEENVDQYFAGGAEATGKDAKKRNDRYGMKDSETVRHWEKYDDRFDLRKEPNEAHRFNYVVEINPWDASSTPVKHTAMGRFKHEGATIHVTDDGQIVAYSGDDARFEYIYKFVSSRRITEGSTPEAIAANMKALDEGTLYVASFQGNSDDFTEGKLPKDGAYDGEGTWHRLATSNSDGSVTSHINGMTGEEVLIFTRFAADKAGATKMDRPEDVEPNPKSGKVYAALTNNDYRGANRPGKKDAPTAEYAPIKENKNGLVLEMDDEHTGESFTWNLLLVCGDPHAAETYFGGFDKNSVSPISCPDNVAFDPHGNLWISTDGNALKSNDGLFAVSLEGDTRGLTKQFLTVPKDAETCGPIVEERRVLVNVQHPGEDDEATVESTTSHWPDGGKSLARPAAVVAWKKGNGPIGS